MAQLGVPGAGCWAPPPLTICGGCHRRREPRVSAIISQTALFQTHFHLTGDLPSFKKDTFLKPWFGNCSLETKTLPLSKLPPESSSPREKGHEEGGLSADGPGYRLSLGPRPTCCHARLHAHPGNLPSCPAPASPLSPARLLTTKMRRKTTRKQQTDSLLTPLSVSTGGTRRAVWRTSPQ